jgi:hypothetical protein
MACRLHDLVSVLRGHNRLASQRQCIHHPLFVSLTFSFCLLVLLLLIFFQQYRKPVSLLRYKHL